MSKHQSGQAIIMLLFFVIVSMMITSSAIIVAFVNSEGSSKQTSGQMALNVAESGAENALIRLLRDPSYTGAGDTSVSGASIIVTTSGSTKTIVSTGTVGNFIRKIQVVVDYTNNVLSIQPNSWREIP